MMKRFLSVVGFIFLAASRNNVVSAQPGNDVCTLAQPLQINGEPVIGTTVNATNEIRASDVVFTFVGNGRSVLVSTCFDETTTAHNLLVRNGGCSSASLGEVSSDPLCTNNANSVSLLFDTVDGRTYPIIVYTRTSGQEGEFAIQVTDFVSPPNDFCALAQPLAIGGDPTAGSTINATVQTRADDVVYTFVGNGRTVLVSTCFDETTTPHNLLVRNGGCTSSSLGEVSSDPSCTNNVNAASIQFDSVNGRTYPIVVYPRVAGQEGNFVIQVTDFVSPSNDNCALAQPLAINGPPTDGSTINATVQTRADDVVYTFVGNGRTVLVSTCFDETTTPHNFLFRNGGCTSSGFGEVSSDLSCTGNVNAASYMFDSVDGRTYPIIVYPRIAGQEGNFAIQITDFVNPSNDNCALAQPLAINGAPTAGSTINATLQTRADDVVFTFVGNGRTVLVSTCFDETTTPHNFLLRNGGCTSSGFGEVSSDPSCTGNVNAASFTFDSVNGRTYPIIVYPRVSGQEGAFAIQVTDFVSPSNDNCALAQPLAINGAPTLGSTVNATVQTRADDVVYTFVGNGRTVLVSTCFDETTTPHNFLLRNGGCTSSGFGEVASDPSCTGNANAASFTFDTVDGRTYPIIVYPRAAGLEGAFAIQVTDFVNPPNDYCPQAQSLEIDGPPVAGTNINATAEIRANDVVFSVVGTGAELTVTTCFAATDFATNIILRNGGCTSSGFGENSVDPDCVGNANAARTTWTSVAGRTYPIYVYSRQSGVEGNFEIQVRDTSTTLPPSTPGPTPMPQVTPTSAPISTPTAPPTTMPQVTPTASPINPPTVAPSSAPPQTCSVPLSEFNASVVVDFRGDATAATQSQLLSLGQGFQETYNLLNSAGSDNCDSFRREISDVVVRLDVGATGLNRALMDVGDERVLQEFSFPLFNRTGSVVFPILFLVQGVCRGCESNANLFNAVDRRILTQEQDSLKESSVGRSLQPGECSCPAGSEIRPPTEIEFQSSFNDTIQDLRETGAVEFVETVDEVVEVDPVQCDTSINSFETAVAIEVAGDPDSLSPEEISFLGAALAVSYNGLAQQNCDPLFRSVEAVEVANILTSPARRSLRDTNIFESFFIEVFVTARCRGCGPETSLFDDVSRVLRTTSSERRLQADQCYCSIGYESERAPSASEFEQSYNKTVAEAGLPNVASTGQTEEVDLTRSPSASPSTKEPQCVPNGGKCFEQGDCCSSRCVAETCQPRATDPPSASIDFGWFSSGLLTCFVVCVQLLLELH